MYLLDIFKESQKCEEDSEQKRGRKYKPLALTEREALHGLMLAAPSSGDITVKSLGTATSPRSFLSQHRERCCLCAFQSTTRSAAAGRNILYSVSTRQFIRSSIGETKNKAVKNSSVV